MDGQVICNDYTFTKDKQSKQLNLTPFCRLLLLKQKQAREEAEKEFFEGYSEEAFIDLATKRLNELNSKIDTINFEGITAANMANFAAKVLTYPSVVSLLNKMPRIFQANWWINGEKHFGKELKFSKFKAPIKLMKL